MLQLTEETFSQLAQLAEIFERVHDICQKIVSMEDDPLPGQLEQSVPGYMDTLKTYLENLRRKRWPILVTGENRKDTAEFISVFLGEKELDKKVSTATTSLLRVTYSDRQKPYYRVRNGVTGTENADSSIIIDNWDGVVEYVLHAEGSSDKSIHKIGQIDIVVPLISLEIQCVDMHIVGLLMIPRTSIVFPQTIAKACREIMIKTGDGVDLLVWPDPSPAAAFQSCLAGPVPVGSIFVTDNDHVLRPNVHSKFGQVMSSLTGEAGMSPVTSALVCLNRQRQVPTEDILSQIKDTVPLVDHSNVVIVPSVDDDQLESSVGLQRINATIRQMVEAYLENVIYYQYSWLQVFVLKVLNALRAFLNQAEKSHEDRLTTYNEILHRVQSLHTDTERFFVFLRQEVDTKVDEALVLLRHYLVASSDVSSRLLNWEPHDCPHCEGDELWAELDTTISQRISARIHNELLSWERNSHFFENMRPYLVELFEVKFLGIRDQIRVVETMLARHDSTISMVDSLETETERDSFFLSIPAHMNLKLRQKIILGLIAPLLLPFAITAAILSLPVLGGLAARDYIVEKLGENKLRDYNADRQKYMTQRTKDELQKFVKSKKLDAFIKSELRPAYRCIEQLRSEVPRQIEAFRSQIETLRNDYRNVKDLSRFYQPLVEVFEHFRQLLLVYKVGHLRRERLDVDFGELEVPDDTQVLCDGLAGTIQTAHWTPGAADTHPASTVPTHGTFKDVSLKFITHKLDIRTIDDYLMEEEAYRLQASTDIARFLGVTKYGGYLYHLIEPLHCNMRQHLAIGRLHDRLALSDREKYLCLKELLLQVVRGLDYLHDRGWVHYDLSLDTVALDTSGKVKLTNISCRKIYTTPRDMSQSVLLRYTHLPPEVLLTPPAAYTAASEMYSVGILMWEMWTANRAYVLEITDQESPIESLNAFTTYIQDQRPGMEVFHGVESTDVIEDYVDNESSPKRQDAMRAQYSSAQSEWWAGRLQQCWGETDRLTSKSLLQQLKNSTAEDMFHVLETHFDKIVVS